MDINKLSNLFIGSYTTNKTIIKKSINTYIDNLYDTLETNKLLDYNVYIGSINNNKIQGDGILLTKNNLLIEGNFDTLQYIDNIKCNINIDDINNINIQGNIVQGDFVYGKIKYNNNTELNGEFCNGYPHNFCKYFCENKNIYYEGDWNQGQMNGLGYYEDNNIKYEGEWSNSKFNGMGTLHENNLIYNGNFVQGLKHGSGTLITDENNFYVEYNHNIQTIKLDLNEKKIFDLENIIEKNKYDIHNSKAVIQLQEKQILQYNQTIKVLEKEKKNIEETFLCKVCFVNIPNILLKPCMHLCICKICEQHIKQSNSQNSQNCPICRKKYITSQEIYIS